MNLQSCSVIKTNSESIFEEVHKLRHEKIDHIGLQEKAIMKNKELEDSKVVRHHCVYLDLSEKDKNLANEFMPSSDLFTKGMAKLVYICNQA